AYMSPEQIRSPGTIDSRSDVYSLGVVLYELLTGECPFQGDNALDLLQQVLHTQPRLPRRLNDRISRDLETIALKCIAKERRERYSTAEELAEDLRRFLDGEAILARPASRWEKLVKWTRKHPVVALLATGTGACAVAVVALVVVGLY